MTTESNKNEKIVLGIETSCDETAVCVIRANMDTESTNNTGKSPKIQILGNSLLSQAKTHAEYGGVFPSIAKREHSKNIVPLFENALKQAGLYNLRCGKLNEPSDFESEIREFLNREPEMAEALIEMMNKIEKPNLDLISVTQGPGLEPALWVGINFAKAISKIWNIPIIPTNHMEGHILSVLIESKIENISFPIIALLISGGHTELVLIKNWHDYTILGRTRDDAVGEAFDKVARILGFPYPGGPKISELAKISRESSDTRSFKLPRPMINSSDFDFSFSGLKTAVLYLVRDLQKNTENNGEISDSEKQQIACEFENAVAEVLISKTKKAMLENGATNLIIGGGVIANKYLRSEFEKMINSINSAEPAHLLIPSIEHSTDNAVMIAVAGFMQDAYKQSKNNMRGGDPEKTNKTEIEPEEIGGFQKFRASGNLSL